MDDDDKPVRQYQTTGIDYVGVEPSDGGQVIVLFDCEGEHHVAVRLPPAVVSLLETRLEQVREELAKRHPPQ